MNKYKNPVILILLLLSLVGCSTGVDITANPDVEILNVVDKGSFVEVELSYVGIEPESFELNVGLGYEETKTENLKSGVKTSGRYRVLWTRILDSRSGTVKVDLEKAELGYEFNGKVHANLSEYPHGLRWRPVAFDMLELK